MSNNQKNSTKSATEEVQSLTQELTSKSVDFSQPTAIREELKKIGLKNLITLTSSSLVLELALLGAYRNLSVAGTKSEGAGTATFSAIAKKVLNAWENGYATAAEMRRATQPTSSNRVSKKSKTHDASAIVARMRADNDASSGLDAYCDALLAFSVDEFSAYKAQASEIAGGQLIIDAVTAIDADATADALAIKQQISEHVSSLTYTI